MSNSFEVAGFKAGVLKAGADLSTKQFHAVKVAADGDVEISGAGEASIGMLQNKPILNEAAEIDYDGISKAVAGAAVANAGVELMANAAGRLIVATSGNRVVAVSLTSASGDGVFFTVKIVGAPGALLA